MRRQGLVGLTLVLVASANTWAQDRPQRRMTIPAPVSVIAFTDDGRSVVAWDPAGYSIWSLESGRVTRREPVFAKACGRTAALPRSENGVTVGVNCRGKLLFFEVATGQSIGEWTLGEARASVAFAAAPDGALVAVVMAGALDTVEVLDRAGKPVAKLKATRELERVSIAPDSRYVAAGSTVGLDVWELRDGQRLASIEGGGAHAFSTDGRTVAVAIGRSVGLYAAAGGTPVRQFEGSASEVRFAPGSDQLAGWTNQQVVVWGTQAGEQRLVLKSDLFVTAALSPDGTRLGTISLELRGGAAASVLAIWLVPSGER